MIAEELAAIETVPAPRLGQVLGHLGIATSSWYRPSTGRELAKASWPSTEADC